MHLKVFHANDKKHPAILKPMVQDAEVHVCRTEKEIVRYR